MTKRFRFFSEFVYDGILLLVVAYISHHEIIACWLNPACFVAGDIADYILWGLIALCALLLMAHDGEWSRLVNAWRKNRLLGLFILYSAASVLWSELPERTLHTAYIMVTSAITASTYSVIRPPRTIFTYLFVFTCLVGVISLATIIVSPEIGIHQDRVWRGAWRGIFSHKNDFGPLMALGNGLAILMFAEAKQMRGRSVALVVYLISFFLVIMSRSATAIILALILNVLSAVFFAWMRWGTRLRGASIGRLTGMLITISGLGLLSIYAIFQLTGKSFQLTGRVPLWANLLENVISKKPWFGYGLETLWSSREFQKWAAVTSGWGNDIYVINGHNGYVDILLYLGFAGLALLSLALALGSIQAATRAFTGLTWLNFFPLLVLVYFLIANITIDYILEFESFHWILLVAILFLPPGSFDEGNSTPVE